MKFYLEHKQQKAFGTLSTASVLAYSRADSKYILDTDAPDYALGAVLRQLQPDDNTGLLIEQPSSITAKSSTMPTSIIVRGGVNF